MTVLTCVPALPRSMTVMAVIEPGGRLQQRTMPVPLPHGHDLLIAVSACGVCRTDLHIIDGELPVPSLPIVPGHEIVGTVVGKGAQATQFAIGERVGVPWLGGSCGSCPYCRAGRENLCDLAVFTGYDRPGGFAQYTLADARYCFALPEAYDDVHAAPLLCAGLIGYRAYAMTGAAGSLGLYGFGAAAHIIAQLAILQGRKVLAFTRADDELSQQYALWLGAAYAGPSDQAPPEPLDAAIIFAPVGALVPQALAAVGKGGTVVCAGIHMSDLPAFPYALLWGERCVRSVANLTRADGKAFFKLICHGEIQTHASVYPLERANEAIADLRAGAIQGAAVLVPSAVTPLPAS